MPHYSVTKAAVLSLSRLVADLYAKDGIRCNAVTPGPTATDAWLGEGGLADQQGGDRDEVLAKVGAGRPLGRLAHGGRDRRGDRLPLLGPRELRDRRSLERRRRNSPDHHLMLDRRATGAALALCLAASQAALLVLTPILTSVAADFGVSTATAGQLRTISGLTAGVTAVLSGLLAARAGLRELLFAGLGLLTLGSALSAVAPDFAILALAQVPIGIGVGLTYSAAVAAVAEWSRPEDRSRVLAVALLGPPLAWVVGMPLGGAAGEASWRLSWVVVPLVLSLAGLAALSRRQRTPPADVAAGLRTVLEQPARRALVSRRAACVLRMVGRARVHRRAVR